MFLKQEEDRYLRARVPDEERALAALSNDGAYAWYNKGALVFHMLSAEIGAEPLTSALRSFVDRFRVDGLGSGSAGTHATVRDLFDDLRSACPDRDLDWFIDFWFERVAVPDMTIVAATVEETSGGWRVRGRATNLEEGRLPVRLEAVRGRFDLDENGDDWNEGFETSEELTLWLEPGVETEFELDCDFEPEAVVLDRRYRCLDFDRTNNQFELESVPAAELATARLK